MALTFEQIAQSDKFIRLPEEKRRKVAEGYFQKNISGHPKFQGLDDAGREKVRANFFSKLSAVPAPPESDYGTQFTESAKIPLRNMAEVMGPIGMSGSMGPGGFVMMPQTPEARELPEIFRKQMQEGNTESKQKIAKAAEGGSPVLNTMSQAGGGLAGAALPFMVSGGAAGLASKGPGLAATIGRSALTFAGGSGLTADPGHRLAAAGEGAVLGATLGPLSKVANPITRRAGSGAVMGGGSAALGWAKGEEFDPVSFGVNTGLGAVMSPHYEGKGVKPKAVEGKVAGEVKPPTPEVGEVKVKTPEESLKAQTELKGMQEKLDGMKKLTEVVNGPDGTKVTQLKPGIADRIAKQQARIDEFTARNPDIKLDPVDPFVTWEPLKKELTALETEGRNAAAKKAKEKVNSLQAMSKKAAGTKLELPEVKVEELLLDLPSDKLSRVAELREQVRALEEAHPEMLVKVKEGELAALKEQFDLLSQAGKAEVRDPLTGITSTKVTEAEIKTRQLLQQQLEQKLTEVADFRQKANGWEAQAIPEKSKIPTPPIERPAPPEPPPFVPSGQPPRGKVAEAELMVLRERRAKLESEAVKAAASQAKGEQNRLQALSGKRLGLPKVDETTAPPKYSPEVEGQLRELTDRIGVLEEANPEILLREKQVEVGELKAELSRLEQAKTKKTVNPATGLGKPKLGLAEQKVQREVQARLERALAEQAELQQRVNGWESHPVPERSKRPESQPIPERSPRPESQPIPERTRVNLEELKMWKARAAKMTEHLRELDRINATEKQLNDPTPANDLRRKQIFDQAEAEMETRTPAEQRADAVRDLRIAEERVAELKKQIPDYELRKVARQVREELKSPTTVDVNAIAKISESFASQPSKWDSMVDEALQRIQQRWSADPRNKARTGLTTEDLVLVKDLAVVGADKILKGIRTLAEFTSAMLVDFPGKFRPELAVHLFQEAYKIAKVDLLSREAVSEVVLDYAIDPKGTRDYFIQALRSGTVELPRDHPSIGPRASILRRADFNISNFDTLMTVFEGVQDGPIKDLLVKRRYVSESEMFQTAREFFTAEEEMIRSAGHDPTSLEWQKNGISMGTEAKWVEVPLTTEGSITMTPSQMIDLYNNLRDTKTGKEVFSGAPVKLGTDQAGKKYQFTEADFYTLEDKLTDFGLLEYADFLQQKVMERGNGASPTYEYITGETYGRQESYWPAVREPDPTMSEPPQRSEYRPLGLDHISPTRERVANRQPLIVQDGVIHAHSTIRQLTALEHMGRVVKDTNDILMHPEVKEALIARFGPRIEDTIKTHIEASNMLGISRKLSTMEKAAIITTKNISRGWLLTNINTIVMQMFGYSKMMHKFANNLGDYAEGSKYLFNEAVGKEMYDNSPLVWDRYHGSVARIATPMLGESSPAMGEVSFRSALQKLKEGVSKGNIKQSYGSLLDMTDMIRLLMWTDACSLRGAWAALKQQVGREHPEWASERQMEWVKERHGEVVRETQNTPSPLDASGLGLKWRHNPFLSLALMFSSDNNKNYQILRQAKYGTAKERNLAVLGVMTNIAFSSAVRKGMKWGVPVLIAGIAGKRVDRDVKKQVAKELGIDAAKGAANTVYLGKVVEMVSTAVSGYQQGSGMLANPLTDSLDNFTGGMTQTMMAMPGVVGNPSDKEFELLMRGVEKSLEGGIPLSGLPLVPPYQFGKRAYLAATEGVKVPGKRKKGPSF
jgi:hypothetical protein